MNKDQPPDPNNDRRSEKRRCSQSKVVLKIITSHDFLVFGTTLDICPAGISLISFSPIFPGTPVEIELENVGKTVGEVVYQHQLPWSSKRRLGIKVLKRD